MTVQELVSALQGLIAEDENSEIARAEVWLGEFETWTCEAAKPKFDGHGRVWL